jgi:PTH1 family peptidyl-tRNA hydrolase
MIVGLGNPENKYLKNRHNIGFSVIQQIIEENNLSVLEKTRYYVTAKYSKFRINSLLVLPLTYMNLSGDAVLRLSIKYGIKPEHIIILVDEYNFPVGKLQIKHGGSDGGHNGIASVMEKLEKNNFQRLRMGIAHNFGPGELVDYVLSDFPPEELEEVKQMKQKAIDSINHIFKAGITRAASDINSGRLWEKKEEKLA